MSPQVICYDNGPHLPISILPSTSPQDRSALEYFILRTSRQLIGSWGASRWTFSIVQCAISEPSIQRVSIALGALHHVHESGLGSQQHALASYVSALRLVHDSITRLSSAKSVLLLACVLFCAFECMNYHLDSAISHLSSGLNLVLQHALTASATAMQDDTGLNGFLLPVLRMLDNDRLCLGAVSSQIMGNASFEIPQTFSSVQEAHQLLTNVLNLSHRQLAAVNEGKTPMDHGIALQKVLRWSETFDAWLPVFIHCASDEDVTNLLPLLSWRTSIGAILKADYTKGEMAWDPILPELKLVVDCAEQFLDLTAEIVMEGEPWKHPLAYTKESAHERAQQTMTVQQGGKITEGILAKLLTRRPSVLSRTSEDDPRLRQGDSPSPVHTLLEKAHSIADRRKVAGRAKMAAEGMAQIRSTFTVSHGIVYPLFAVVARCRDPPTRKRALRLLESCNRHEGLWDSKLAAQSAKRRIMVEETQAINALRDENEGHLPDAGLGAVTSVDANQIPNHCRVRATGRTFLPNGKVLERFCLGWKGTLQEALTSGEKERWIELGVEG